MAVVGRGSGHILAAILILLIQEATNAPVTEDGPSQALQFPDATGDGRGCYYNFEHYEEGERILTNEPCLNCTCHNRMLMCYLRVCPFTKAIGQDCTVEKKPDQCCPVITCPQVHVALLTSTTSETPPTTTALGRPDNYGCILEDNTFYADGAQVPSDPKKPCELCYCIRNHTACVMQECTLNVEGCKPVYQEGVCCPVRYDCDYDEVSTTPKPTGLVTTPGATTDCLHNSVTYHDGAMVTKDEKAPCEHCYCMRGDIVCAVQECGTPLEGRDCTPLERTPGQCCPNYHCANTTQSSESLLTSTEKLPESVKDESEVIKQESAEPSSESENSSEEVSSHEVSEAGPPKVSEPEDNESHSQEVSQPTDDTSVHTELPAAEISHAPTESPQPPETASVDGIKTEEDIPTQEHQEDSHSAASHEESHEIVKDPQVTNEIPAATLQEQSAAQTTTEEPPVEAARIPGEGSCLVEGKTYAHNTIVPTENPCQEVCRCFSSIVSCKPRDCPPAPSPSENCLPVTTPGSCCPTYTCDQKTSDAPEVQDHKIDTHDDDDSHLQDVLHTTLPPSFEELPDTEAPAVVGIPPSLIPGGNEHGLTVGSEEEETNMPHVETQKEEDSASQSQEVNSNIVHGHDASLHGDVSSENIDSQVNGNVAQPISGISTDTPGHADSSAEANQENVQTESHTVEYVSPTEQPVFSQNEDTTQSQTVSSLINRDEEKIEEVHKHDEAESQSSVTEHSDSGNLELTTPLNIVHDGETDVDHSLEENTSESEEHVPSSSSEETKNDEVQTTAAPELEAPPSDLETDVTHDEQSHSDDISEDKPAENEEHEMPSHSFHPDTSPETTTLPSVSQDNISSQEENNKPSEEIYSEHYTPTGPPDQVQTEKTEESGAVSGTQTSVEEHLPTTTTPEEAFQNLFEHNPGSEKEEEVKQDETPTESAPAQEEAQTPISAQPAPEEIVTTSSEIIHHDSIPDSSHHSEETAENVDSTEPTKPEGEKAEENVNEGEQEQIATDSQEKLPSETTAPSVSVPETSEQEASENQPGESEKKPIQQQPEATSSPVGEQEPAIQIQDTTEEQKKQEVSTPNPVNIQEESTLPAKEHEASSASSQASHDEISTIIYEEVKVTGMPPIESHVTEENLDHSVIHQEVSHQDEATTQASIENHEISSAAPEGLGEEIKNEEPTKENESTVPSVENSSSSQESTDQKDAEPFQETSEGTTQPPTSPEVINEEEESLNQITSDNTAQLIDDNQIIQNEVNNQLHPEVQPVHDPTNEESEPSVEYENVSNESVGDKVDLATTSPAIQEHSSAEAQQTIEPSSQEETNKDVQEETTGSVEMAPTESTSMEKEPNQDLSGEGHSESEGTVTNEGSVTSPPEHETASISADSEEIHEQQPVQEEEESQSQEESEGSGQKESSTEPSQSETQEESESSEKEGTPNETSDSVENTPAPEAHSEATESINKIEDESNKIPSIQTEETPETKPSEEQPTTETPAEALQDHVPQVSQDGEQNPPGVIEEQNAIPEEASHAANSDSQVPFSTNQVLEESGEDGNSQSTEQSVHESSHEISHEQVPLETLGEGEVVKNSTEEATHEEGNVPPSEQNVDGEGTNEQSIEHVQQETQQGEHIPEENVTATPDSQHHSESHSEDSASASTEHQEGTLQSQEVTTESSSASVTEVSQEQSNVSQQENDSEKAVIPESHQEETNEAQPERPAVVSDSEESGHEHHETISAEHQEPPPEEHKTPESEHQEAVHEHQESAAEHHESDSHSQFTSPHPTEDADHKEVSTAAPYVETSPDTVQPEGNTESHEDLPAKPSVGAEQDSQNNEDPTAAGPGASVAPEITPTYEVHQPTQNILHSTEPAVVSEITSSTAKPVEEPNPMFPSWSQKPFDQQTTPESHHAEENPYPSGFEPEYEDEEGVSYGPGTCRYGGKIYLSAQQIPRDDPCDFCFCFRSDIICLQQSCPPPIRGCYQETIKGFCCPRYECHVSMATMLNITTTTTTTTTTLPPHFFAHAYNGAATKAGCQVKGVAYHVGERIPSTSGPCLDCRCGANGQMKCDPTVCGPQEALLRQVMDAAVSRRRR